MTLFCNETVNHQLKLKGKNMSEQPDSTSTGQAPDHPSEINDGPEELKLSLKQTQDAVLVREAAERIRESFANPTDFNTISDLRNCISAAQNEIDATVSAINNRPPHSGWRS